MPNFLKNAENEWIKAKREPIAAHAERMAERTNEFLGKWFDSIGYEKPIPLPITFTLELAAILLIDDWQSNKCTEEIGSRFKQSDELWNELVNQFMEAPASFGISLDHSALPLHSATLKIYLSEFSMTALKDLGVDVVIHSSIDDGILDLFIDLLWENRHLSNSLIEVQNG